jgi:Protein of unknown function (DUF1501)
MSHLRGPTRRNFLRVGGMAGLSLVGCFAARAQVANQTANGFGRAKRCLLLFLTGGPPQHDTFDPKPDAPAEIRGELRPIATSTPGIRITELCPLLARCTDKFCIVRSVTHRDTVHTSAGYTMLTGADHTLANTSTAANIRPNGNDHPHFGSLLARNRPQRDGAPAFVSLPESIKDAGVNEFPGQGAGFLGKQFDPFLIEAVEGQIGFRTPDIVLPSEMPASRLDQREALLAPLNGRVPNADRDSLYRRAFGLMRSPAVRSVFDLHREPTRVRSAYGDHLFGQGCLLARRLLEAEVPLVTVYWHYEGPDDSPVWDTHQNNFPHLRNRLVPPTDRAVATLLEDLFVRGMLDDTLFIVMGEFGRTPRINKQGGRDHWPGAQSILLAGAGIRGGSIYGASDRIGAYPADAPVTPVDLIATFLHLLGIPSDEEVRDRTGRVLKVCHGMPIRGLVG